VLGEICKDVLPPGVANIVTGNGMPTGDALVRHPKVKRIAFTGSVPTGRAILKAAAEGGIKNVTLELGGKNPFIAFPDQDPDKIAQAAVGGMNFAWQGQSCGSTSRLLLHESLYKPVLDRIVERVAALRLGDPLDPQSQMGPINSKRQYERVQSMVQSGVSEGARLMTGGKRPPGGDFKRGYWIEPTVFGDVDRGMRIAREEIFGPVLSVFRWKDEQEAYDLANATEYGLTASIWTNDLKTAFRAARAVKSGYIWVNGASGHFYGTPFGGMKSSGLGREEGSDELLSYTENKTIHLMLG
jgi:acyl-CoA reductase-like NAD-dependent aldehyde dehydrogenase